VIVFASIAGRSLEATELIRRFGNRAAQIVERRIDAALLSNDMEAALSWDQLLREVVALLA